MNLKNLLKLIDKIPFRYKTSFLLFIITGGMISIILLSQVSIYTVKNDFDFLLEKRTKPIIKLERIKDTFTINIYDTLSDIKNKNISVTQSRDVILLAQQLIHKNWTSYKNTNIHSDYKAYFITKIMKDLLLPSTMPEDKRLQTSIIQNIDKKIILINKKVNHIYILFKQKKEKKAIKLINKLYYDINSININLTNLTAYDLNLAIQEKLNTQKVFNTLSLILNISILFVFFFSILLTIIITNNFKRTHHLLKDVVSSKTQELQKLNDSLEKRIKDEVNNSRKKDMIMFQQARLASLGEMIANIAHQWRQPLSSIMMIVQSFQTKMSLGKLNQEFVDRKVQDAMLLSNNMSNTLEDFQNFFKPNKDKTLFDLKDCINNSLELSKYFLEQERIQVSFIIKNSIKTYGFYNELSHVILNFISNSKDVLKDKKDNKLIKIILKESEDHIIIRIYDNGGGVNKEVLPQIFEPYYTTKYKSAGTGLGLYMSKQIIEKHMNGSIKCKNVQHNMKDQVLEACALFIIKIPILKANNG